MKIRVKLPKRPKEPPPPHRQIAPSPRPAWPACWLWRISSSARLRPAN